jgi:hypothetical protein
MAKQEQRKPQSDGKNQKSRIGENIQNRGQMIPKPSSELNINPKKKENGK